jgi:hypothetical protein
VVDADWINALLAWAVDLLHPSLHRRYSAGGWIFKAECIFRIGEPAPAAVASDLFQRDFAGAVDSRALAAMEAQQIAASRSLHPL